MNKKVLKLFIAPLVIAAIYFAAQAFFLFNQFGVFSIVEETPIDFKKTNQQDIHLLKNQKATATFKASENNLGIILVQLVKFGKGSDQIVFRIKEEGEKEWYHESTFSGDQVKNDQYFPLGFPPIVNSKNNTYFFEIESQEGKYQNGIGVLKEKKAALMYKYSTEDLKNYDALLSFASKKFAYVVKNIKYWQVTTVFVVSSLLILLMKKKKITAQRIVRFLLIVKNDPRRALRMTIDGIKSIYLLQKKKIIYFFSQLVHWFVPSSIYLYLLNTKTKKRIIISLLIFLLALTYRFSSTLVNQHLFFYAGIGGQGDYDQFIRAATCALNFCSYAILGQNFLIETSILGTFYKIFGFTGALKAYLYLMIILSSIIAALPYLLLSRKNWITLGGILGSIYLATSDFLTHMSLNFPPDNGSLFTFSIFFIVYLLTINIRTIKWLLLFGLIGLLDGLNKALFLLNDLVAFVLFVPVFFLQKAKRINKFPFVKLNSKLIFLSLLPLLIFLTIYSAWEIFVQIKFTAPYFLRGLVQSGGASYVSYTSFSDSSLTGSIISQLFYLSGSAIVMIKRLIEYTNLRIIFLAPIFLGMIFFSFIKPKFPVKKFILSLVFSIFTIVLLLLIKDNYYKIHQIFPVEYIPDNWKTNTYVRIFLFSQIIVLFILNFKYSALKLSLPILPYVIILIILAKNSPFSRLHTHVVAWSIILLALLIDWIMMNIKKYSPTRIRILLPTILSIIFIFLYGLPKAETMIKQLSSGFISSQNQVRYLKWVEKELPRNAVVLAGGKSDLVTLTENIKRPIVYNTLWSAALLIKPKEIPGISPTDFSIVPELKNKDNFKRKKYVILEDDIYIWQARVSGASDNLFSTNLTTLNAEDYSLRVYRYNQTLKKAIYELNLKDNL